MTIIGLDGFGMNAFKSYSPPVRDIKHITLKNAIYDELHIREKTSGIDLSPTKEDWQMDTILLAKFLGDLEAGNVNNQGVQITKFAIKRRKVNEIESVTLGYKDFVNNNQFVYEDYTQANDDYIYSIVPVGENELEGQENNILVKSEFTGWHVVEKETNEVVSFDTYINSANEFSSQLNQGRIQIDTLGRFPSFFYTNQDYHSFQLTATFLPEEWRRSGFQYEAILNQFARSHKPFLVKGGSGEVYICDVSAPSKTAPQNVWTDYDYMNLTLSFTEIMTYNEYMELTK